MCKNAIDERAGINKLLDDLLIHLEQRGYALNKFGLATAVNPAEPVITTPFAPPLQWTISRLPSASVPPAMPTWESSG